jgi:acetyl-CoA C-acetyltransferase
VNSLRKRETAHGWVTANGMYLTKHSLGIYSTEPPTEAWQNGEGANLQQQIEAIPVIPQATDPSGNATIETYTVSYDREGPKKGIVIARNSQGERIVANTGTDADTLDQLLKQDPIGHSGNVRIEDGINILEL